MSFHRFSLLPWPAKLLIPTLALTLSTAVAQQSKPSNTQAPATKQVAPVKPAPPTPQHGAQQAEKPATPATPAAAPPDPGASLPPDTPVITINNVCSPGLPGSSGASQSSSGCKTIITKAEFEKLVSAGNEQTTVPPATRTRIVQPFAQTLVLDATAEKRGVDKNPEVENFLKVTHMSALARALQQQLVKQAQQVTPEQIDEYYKQHQSDFEEAKISRLFIPKIAASENIDQAKAKALAEQLQKEAATGKDMQELEKQAYTDLGLKQTPPNSDMGVRRRNAFPPAHQEAVFGLSAGQVTPVLEDANAFYVYKVESKTTVPETNVSNEIKQSVAQKNFREELHSIFDSAETTLNPDYFDGMKTIDWNMGEEHEGRAAPPPPRAPGRPTNTPPSARQPK
jgi:hypothetical protein